MGFDREDAETTVFLSLEGAKKKYHDIIQDAEQRLKYLNGDCGGLCSSLEAFLGGADDATLEKLLLLIEIGGVESPEVRSFMYENIGNVTDFYKISNIIDARSTVHDGWTNMLDYITGFINEKTKNGEYLNRDRDFVVMEKVHDALMKDFEQYVVAPDMQDEYLSTINVLENYIVRSRQRQINNPKVVSILQSQ